MAGKAVRQSLSRIMVTIIGLGIVFLYGGCNRGVFADHVANRGSSADLSQVNHDKGFLDRNKVMTSAKLVTRKAYPNADEVQVDDFILARYEPNGTSKEWDDAYIKVLTEKGKRDNQSLSYSFSLPYGTVKVSVLEIIKPNGKVVPIDITTQSKVMVDRSQMSENIYNPNNKVLRVGVPGLEVGDVLHTVTCRITVKPRVPDTWTDYQVFEYQNPIKHTVYEIEAPMQLLPKKIALKSEIKGTVSSTTFERAGRKVYRWEVKNVPQMYPEPSMPAFYTVVQRLLVSTIPNWQYVSKWYWNLSKPHLEKTTPDMVAKVKELTAGLKTRDAKIRAIFRWVSQEVRYMGITIEKNAPGYEPHDVDMTFKSKAGVCRDKAALLVAMLRLAGFDAFPVLINAGPKKDKEVPVPYFNHAISCVKNPDGSYTLMDSTNESTKDLFPAYLSDKSFLVACPKGEMLKTSPIIPAAKNLVLVSTKARVDNQGNLSAETKIRFNGINDTVYRGYFASLNKDNQQRYFEGLVKRVVPGAKLLSYQLEPQNVLDTTKPLVARCNFSARNVLIGNSGIGTKMLPQLWVGTKVGMVNFVLRKTGLKKRRFPLVTDFACGVRETLDLQIAGVIHNTLNTANSAKAVLTDHANSNGSGGDNIVLPGFTDIKDDVITWQRKMTSSGSHITGHNNFLIKVVEFTPSQYLKMKKDLKDIEYNSRKMVILQPGSAKKQRKFADADKVVLDAQVEYHLKDAHNWTEIHHVKERILTYKGKKDNAELKINYNPAWEKVRLIKAVVTTGGKVQHINKLEQNIMDAGWVAAAPRYPAGKTLVASLPGVEAGSVIEYEYEKTCRNHPFFVVTQVFKDFAPILHKQVKLIVPAGTRGLNVQACIDNNGIGVKDDSVVGIDVAVGTGKGATISAATADTSPNADMRKEGNSGGNGFIKQHKRLIGGNIVYQWDAYNQSAIKEENNLPPLYSFNPMLRLAVMGPSDDLSGYAAKLQAVLNKAADLQANPDTKARALQIVKGISNTTAKVKAIRDFVSQNIRLAGPGITQVPFSAVSSADTTLADGYGNMTDRAVLLYAMLKAALIDNAGQLEYVLASRISRIGEIERFEQHYPDPRMFMAILVRVKLPQGAVYLNDTDQYAKLGTTASDGYLAYFTSEKCISRIRSLKGMHNYTVYNYHVKLQANGDAIMTVSREYYGTYFGANRKMFAEMTPEYRNRYYQQLVSGISQSATPLSKLITNYSSYPGRESFTVKVSRYAVRDANYLYFNLPQTLYDLFGLRSDTHINPFYNGSFTSFVINTTIELPVEFSDVVLAPAEFESALPGGVDNSKEFGPTISQIKIVCKRDGRKINYIHEVSLKPFIIGSADYNELQDLNSKLSNARSREILLRRSSDK